MKEFIEANHDALVPKYEPTLWEADTHEALLRLSQSKGVASNIARKARSRFLDEVTPRATRFVTDFAHLAPYRAPLSQCTWGSNKAKAM